MVHKRNNEIKRSSPLSNSILCKNGWKKIKDIKIGEEVFNEKGYLSVIEDIKNSGVNDIYKVTLKNGTSFNTSINNTLRIVTKKQISNFKLDKGLRYMNLYLDEIMQDFSSMNTIYGRKTENHKYCIFPIDNVNFNYNKNLIMNPYLLGLLLGDGGFTGNVVTFTNAEDDIFLQVEKLVQDLGAELHYRNFENHKQATICSKIYENHNVLNEKLKQLKLFGLDSRQKFIPTEYIYSSVEDRLNLLSGIINTDGHISARERIVIATYSKQMYKDISDICKSLGINITCSEYDRTNDTSTSKYDKEIEYRIVLYCNDFSIFKLSEKHKSKITHRPIYYVNKIVDINKIGCEETVELVFNDKSCMYITDDYIATY